MNQAQHHPLAGQRIGLLGREGSGTSTCTAFLARALTESGYAVRAADAAPDGAASPRSPDADADLLLDKMSQGLEFGATEARPVTLLDFEAGTTDLPPGAVESLDWAVVVIDPSCAGVKTAVTLRRRLEEQRHEQPVAARPSTVPDLVPQTAPACPPSHTKGAVCVLNKVPDSDTEFLMWQQLLEAGLHAVASIPDEPRIRQAWLEGHRLDSATAHAEAAKIVRALEQESGAWGQQDQPINPSLVQTPCPGQSAAS